MQPFVSIIDVLEREPSPSSSLGCLMSKRTLLQILTNVRSSAIEDRQTYVQKNMEEALRIISKSQTAVKHDGSKYKLVPID